MSVAMAMPQLAKTGLLLLTLTASLSWADIVWAQGVPNPPPQDPPDQNTIDLDNCGTQFNQQQIPKTQLHSFLNECMTNLQAARAAGQTTTSTNGQ